ncbi:MAG: enoyl-CoA hydratase/isomerase family protein [Clostridia bacterium]|nr:enoyl-CoA hydratase/isomerase family protein [Clostridia bacterium]
MDAVKWVRVETRGAVAVVTMERPPVNALSGELVEDLAAAFAQVARPDACSAVVFTGAGDRAFCAGADIKEQAASSPTDLEERSVRVRALFNQILDCPKPVIAAVNGPALGAGCVLAAVCDIRVASERATFGLPELNVGLLGGARHLGRLIPQGKLRLMYFTAEPIDAVEAYRVGLAEAVVPHGRLLDEALALAGRIAAKSPIALRYAKMALNECEFLPLKEGYALEQGYTAKLRHTEDAREARRAFAEKREPRFTGR